MIITAWCDGSVRGSLGGLGYRFEAPRLFEEHSWTVKGLKSNEAEFLAALVALRHARVLGAKSIRLWSDATMLVGAIQGTHKMKAGCLPLIISHLKLELKMFCDRASVAWLNRSSNPAHHLAYQATQSAVGQPLTFGAALTLFTDGLAYAQRQETVLAKMSEDLAEARNAARTLLQQIPESINVSCWIHRCPWLVEELPQ